MELLAMAVLNVAVGCLASATFRAPASGSVAITVGGIAATAVVKVQTWLAARAMEVVSLAPVVTVAVYWVFSASAADGVKVAVLLGTSKVTFPETGAPPCVSV
jgi:hypothetical protein